MPASNRPTIEEVSRLLKKLEPEIARRFQEKGVSPEEAARRIDDALVALALRWNQVGDRERWLLWKLDPGTGPVDAGSSEPTGKEPEE